MNSPNSPIHEQIRVEATRYIKTFKISIVLHGVFLLGQAYALTLMKLVSTSSNQFGVLFSWVDNKMSKYYAGDYTHLFCLSSLAEQHIL
jgi:hypothetical protein